MTATKLPNTDPAQSCAPSSKAFSKCADRNLKGIALEKEGNVDAAIALYEANITAQFPGTHPYERLRIIYTKQKRWDDAIRVCRAYIQFGQVGDLALKEKLRRFTLQHTSAVESSEDPIAVPNDESAERERKPSTVIRDEKPSATDSRQLQMRMTNAGIEMNFGVPCPRLEASPTADQSKPKRYYVYAHQSADGVPFYIGKGTDDRAWSKDRDALWHRFVETRLAGAYKVVILADNLAERQAEELEAEWIAQEPNTLVNWINAGRKFDLEANARFHRLRNANRLLIEQARTRERTNLAEAIEMYRRALDATAEYAFIDDEQGLVSDLMREERQAIGNHGEIGALDRFTKCLLKLGRVGEARAVADTYFDRYRFDATMVAGAKIRQRIEKAELAARNGVRTSRSDQGDGPP